MTKQKKISTIIDTQSLSKTYADLDVPVLRDINFHVRAGEQIAIVGTSGSGKSTFAKELEDELGYPRLELDSYFHLPGWEQKPDVQFKSEVQDFLGKSERDAGGWIVDGNYLSKLEDLVISRADVVIWFNLPKSIVMSRVIRRSIRRAATREELWNGNRESFRNLFTWNPETNIIRWSWTQYSAYVDKLKALANKAPKDQEWLEIRSEADLNQSRNYLAAINL